MLKKQDGLSAAISTLVFKSLIFVFAFLKHIVIAGAIGLTIKLDILHVYCNYRGFGFIMGTCI